jgi:hypothetical protein
MLNVESDGGPDVGRPCNQGQTTDSLVRAMKSNIGEPFLLATYTSTIRGIHLLTKPGVYATVSQKSSSDDHVTVAVQADGVHILDVGCFTLHLTNGFDWNIVFRYLHCIL